MKKIIALAVASAFIAPAAMAEVVVYGSLRTSVEYAKMSDTSADFSKVRLVDQSSRLGFKGTDKLDNGLTVLWQAEQRVRVGASNADGTNNASVGWGDRDTFVGLQGGFGLIRAGRFDDIIDASRGDFYGALGGLEETSSINSRFVRRGAAKSNNTIAYHSPSFGGFGFKAQYVMGEKNATADNRGYAATAFYKHSLFELGAGYKAMNDTTSSAAGNYPATFNADGTLKATAAANTAAANGDKYKYYVVGGSVMPIAGLKFSAAVDQTKVTDSGTETKQVGYGLGAQYDMGKYSFQTSYGKLNDKKVNGVKNTTSGAWGAEVGMTYALSKQTKLLAGVSYIKNESGSSLTTNTSAFDATAGADLTSVSVGIRTDF